MTEKKDMFETEILPRLGKTKKDLGFYKADRLDWEELYAGCEEAVELFLTEDITGAVIWDCDVDGVYSGDTTEKILNHLGIKTVHYMNTLKQHGLVAETMDWIEKENPDFVFVVDAGSGDVENLNKLSNKGIKCFVLDHHPYDKTKKLNDDVVRLNCSDYEHLPELSGCGVVYRFFEGLSDLIDFDIEKYQANVGITVLSDICDMSDLENRYYVREAYKKYQNNLFLKSFDFYGSYRSFYLFGVVPYLNRLVRVGYRNRIFKIMNSVNIATEMNKIAQHRFFVKTKETEMIEEINKVSTIFNLDGIVISLRRDLEEYKTVNGLLGNYYINEYDKSALVLLQNPETKDWGGSFRGWNFDNTLLKEWGFDCFGHLNACGAYINNKDLYTFIKKFDYVGEHKQKYLMEIDDGTSFDNKTWIKIAEYNEYSGTNMEAVVIKLNIKEEDAIETMISKNGRIKTYYFEGFEITDFNAQDSEEKKEFLVEPVLYVGSQNKFRLLRR